METKEEKKTREIDVISLAGKVFAEKKLALIICTVCGIIGVIVALNTPKYYTTSVTLAPESSNDLSGSGKLGSVSSMLGLKLGSAISSDAIYPEIYPDIFASTDFLVSLFDIPIKLEKDTITKPYYLHLMQDGKIPFWGYPRLWLSKLLQGKNQANAPTSKVNPFWLTKEQAQLCEAIRNSITCTVDKKTDVITLSVTDGDKLVAATMADTLQNRLQQYITMYRTKKARYDLAFMEELFKQSKADYLEAQHKYATAADANQDVFLTTAKVRISDLENDMQLKYNIYSEVTQQLQANKQRVQERTPAFTVIQGATVPNKASSFPRSFIVLVYIFIGLIADAAWVLFGRDVYHKIIRKKK